MIIVRVLIHGYFSNGIDYIYPFTTPAIAFTRALVPLGPRKIIGVISEINPTIRFPTEKLKKVIKILDSNTLLSPKAIQILTWLANYYQCNLHQAIKLSIPKYYLQKEHPKVSCQIIYQLSDKLFAPPSNAHKQDKVIKLLQKKGNISHTELLEEKINHATLKVLIQKKVITRHEWSIPDDNSFTEKETKLTLTNDQQLVVQYIHKNINNFKTFLLFGITGSGKTEVYIEAIKPLVKNKKQILILVPEINLTPQTLERFQQNFCEPIVVIHSQLTNQARFDLFAKVKNRTLNIIIATRSGLLIDTPNLGMIIVDEEHDSSYKQANNPTYHARDIAIVKAKQHNVPIILGSGTPSIESYYHAINGKYELLTLKKRALNQLSNQVYIINLQKQKTQAGISATLLHKIKQTISKNEQVLLFINRRGYAHSLICQKCGWCANCNQCQKPYTLHRTPQHLACHFCGKMRDIILQCPNCQSPNLNPIGNGTEKLEDTLNIIFPSANILRLDRSITKKKGTLETAMHDIRLQKIDIIIGTQMITKGHDFQNVSLVGIINVDAGFYSKDFHAVEKTAQLITQVIGRTGRGSKAGDVYIQTYQPDNPLLQLILESNYELFLLKTLKTRKLLRYPPYTYQVYIYAQVNKASVCIYNLQKIYQTLINYKKQENLSCKISQVLPAINIKQAGNYRFMLMLTSDTRKELQQLLKAIATTLIETRKKVKLTIDIDPVDIK